MTSPTSTSRLGTTGHLSSEGTAAEAREITTQGTIAETAPTEARGFNTLQHRNSGESSSSSSSPSPSRLPSQTGSDRQTNVETAPASADPLFPPLPAYGPPTPLRRVQCTLFKVVSGVLSICFLGVVVLGALAESVLQTLRRTWCRVRCVDPDKDRPFLEIERRREKEREEERKSRKRRRWRVGSGSRADEERGATADWQEKYGGKDQLKCDIQYYARRVGLDCETLIVETEDGFLLEMQHIWDPQDPPYYPERKGNGDDEKGDKRKPRTKWVPPENSTRVNGRPGRRKYPVLLIHGLLQSAGAFAVNDDDSLAFFLVKSGYDVFLGNSRCGFRPRHTVLHSSDPRMWAWNIRQMGVLDLPAFIDVVLTLTSFPRLALGAHSQGTALTFIALAKQQLPSLGPKISVFCALAPAVYAGPLINKVYFKFMRIMSPGMFRVVFGIHAFIPLMMSMHRLVPAKIYGNLGYKVFNFLFEWGDTRWDRGLRDRFFQFAPVYISSESMRWWLGCECFAKHRCILATRSEHEDPPHSGELKGRVESAQAEESPGRGGGAWFQKGFPKLALWIAGSDKLVDGGKLVRRIVEERKEPDVELVHWKVIEEYEHLDVVWAVDARERVFEEIREVVWREIEEEERKGVVVPQGVGALEGM